MAKGTVSSPIDPSSADNWHGGFYELSIKLGEHDDDRLNVALLSLWEAAGLERPFRRDPKDSTIESAALSAESLLAGSLSSRATIPGLGQVLCSVFVVRAETYEGGETSYGDDWLDLCLHLGSLGNLDPRVGGYPFGSADTREWRAPIETWFERVGRAVFAAIPFAHAVTGFEVSGTERSEASPGWVGLLAPDAAGDVVVSPVTNW